LGWTWMGEANLCRQVALEFQGMRGRVGEEARGGGTVSYQGEGSVKLALKGSEGATVSPAEVSFQESGKAGLSTSFTCQQEGSFVAKGQALEGNAVAVEAPIVVTCLDQKSKPGSGNPPDFDLRFFGDPHLITLDGAAYDFHATGEFWAIYAESMPLQMRFVPMPGNPEATYIGRLAARLGQARVEVAPLYGWTYEGLFLPNVPLQVLVEGEDRTEELTEKGYLALPGDGYVAVSRWAEFGRRATGQIEDRRPLELVLVYPGENPRPAVVVRARQLGGVRLLEVGAVRPGKLAGTLKGLMGNANGDPGDDFATRDGRRLSAPLTFGQLYGVYGPSWEVASGERLFSDPAPQVRYPKAPPVLDPAKLREAEAYCGTLTDAYLRQACFLDAAVSGDPAGAARGVQEAAGNLQGAQGGLQPATQGARLGVSPMALRIGAGAEAEVVLANPTEEAVRYRLQVVGEGPGLRVDGTALAPGEATPELTLAPRESRRLRLSGLCPERPSGSLVYLLSVEERDATEARGVLVEVTCDVGLDLRLLTPEASLAQGGQTTLDLVLRPLNLQGEAEVALSLWENGAPAAGLSLEPNRLRVQGSGEQTFTVRLKAAADAATGERLLRLRASLGNSQQEATLRVQVTNLFVWTGAGDGRSMADCRNWAPGQCPGPENVAEIVNESGVPWTIEMNLPGLGFLKVRGPVTLTGGPLVLVRGGQVEGEVNLQGHLVVAPGGTLQANGLTIKKEEWDKSKVILELQGQGENLARAVFQGENRFLAGTLRGPGILQNQGLLRSSAYQYRSKYICLTLQNAGTVRIEGWYTHFGCDDLPGVLEGGTVELVDGHIHNNDYSGQGGSIRLEGPEARFVVIGSRDNQWNFTEVPVHLKNATLNVQCSGQYCRFNSYAPFHFEDATIIVQGQDSGVRLWSAFFQGTNTIQVAERAGLEVVNESVLDGTLQGEVQGKFELGSDFQVPEGKRAILNLTGNGLWFDAPRSLRGPGILENRGLLHIENNPPLCLTLQNTGTIRTSSYSWDFGCDDLPGVLENQGQVVFTRGDKVINTKHPQSAIHNRGGFRFINQGWATVYIYPTFYAEPGGYEEAEGGSFWFREYRNLR
ncbi:hypothetical protein, partial [Thermus sp.]|uniref:hypothetical protein n=1 Tax=Thermus sp. TaxID=275 RepID=UPI003D0A391C